MPSEEKPAYQTITNEEYKDLGLLAIFPYVGLSANRFLDDLNAEGTQYMLFVYDNMIYVHEVEYR